MKKLLSILILIICTSLITSPAFSFFKDYIKEAQTFYNNTDYKMAVNTLDKAIQNSNISGDKLPKAYSLMGMAYDKMGYGSQAQVYFRKAVATDANKLKYNNAFKYLNLSQIEEIKGILLTASKSSNDIRNKYAQDIFIKFKESVGNENFNQSDKLYRLAREFGYSSATDFGKVYLREAENRKGSRALPFLERANSFFSNGSDLEGKVGITALNKISEQWDISRNINNELKELARKTIGDELVNRVLPKTYMKTVFSKTFTKKDFDVDDGGFRAFRWGGDDVRVKDHIEIIGNPTSSSFLYYNGARWVPIENGHYDFEVKVVQSGKSFYVASKDPNATVVVRAKRKITTKPQFSLIKDF